MFSTEHMYPKLKAFAQAKRGAETYQALPYMRECHVERTRKPMRGLEYGIPYITHPLTMACQAHAMGIREDAVFAVAP